MPPPSESKRQVEMDDAIKETYDINSSIKMNNSIGNIKTDRTHNKMDKIKLLN